MLRESDSSDVIDQRQVEQVISYCYLGMKPESLGAYSYGMFKGE